MGYIMNDIYKMLRFTDVIDLPNGVIMVFKYHISFKI